MDGKRKIDGDGEKCGKSSGTSRDSTEGCLLIFA